MVYLSQAYPRLRVPNNAWNNKGLVFPVPPVTEMYLMQPVSVVVKKLNDRYLLRKLIQSRSTVFQTMPTTDIAPGIGASSSPPGGLARNSYFECPTWATVPLRPLARIAAVPPAPVPGAPTTEPAGPPRSCSLHTHSTTVS